MEASVLPPPVETVSEKKPGSWEAPARQSFKICRRNRLTNVSSAPSCKVLLGRLLTALRHQRQGGSASGRGLPPLRVLSAAKFSLGLGSSGHCEKELIAFGEAWFAILSLAGRQIRTAGMTNGRNMRRIVNG
jgi:hypothetical protein